MYLYTSNKCLCPVANHVCWQRGAPSSLLNLLFGPTSSSEDVAARFRAPIGMALAFEEHGSALQTRETNPIEEAQPVALQHMRKCKRVGRHMKNQLIRSLLFHATLATSDLDVFLREKSRSLVQSSGLKKGSQVPSKLLTPKTFFSQSKPCCFPFGGVAALTLAQH